MIELCDIVKLLFYYPSFLFTFHLLDIMTFFKGSKSSVSTLKRNGTRL